jgi:uncharacterized cupredoxin-like copper-binding protein
MKRRLALPAFVIVAVVVLLVMSASPGLTASGATTVSVSATEMKFTLSKKSVQAGSVTFVVKNTGKAPHDFKIAGKKTPILKPGKSARLTVALKKGSLPYLCTVAGHAAAGMKGSLKVVQ